VRSEGISASSGPTRQDDERSVRLGDAHRFALASVDAVARPPATVEARGLQAVLAEHAGAVRPRERGDDEVAPLDRAHARADGFDEADELVPHAAPGLGVLHRLVGPEVAAADAGARDGDERVGRLDQVGVGDVLDPNVAGAVHDSCAHAGLPFVVKVRDVDTLPNQVLRGRQDPYRRPDTTKTKDGVG
jgi:hypothetical protein